MSPRVGRKVRHLGDTAPVAEAIPGTCSAVDCERPTAPGHILCPAHERRRSRGQDLSAPVGQRLKPWARLTAAALAYADCDAENDLQYDHVAAGLRYAAERWCRSRGWRPPAKESEPERAAEAAA